MKRISKHGVPPHRGALQLSDPGRRQTLAVLALGMTAAGLALPARQARAGSDSCPPVQDWQEWQEYLKHFVQEDGRVLDASTPKQHSSSESQSYGMFFALAANDPATFEKIWRWSINNLAGGNIGTNLPAWIWGKSEEGEWRVLDSNSASDAELWFIYALAEAARAWNRPDYLLEARALLAQVEAKEIDDLPGLGKMLLPGPRDFVHPEGIWQLNPSYLPLPVLRRLARLSPNGPWQEIATNTMRMFSAITPAGFAADWVAYQGDDENSGHFVSDPIKGELGSYDAIRVYLWAGLTHPEDPLSRAVLRSLHGMRDATQRLQAPPEKVQVMTGSTENTGPFGFSSALVPYFQALGDTAMADAQAQRAATLWRNSINAAAGQDDVQPPYYDNMLHLFSTGWQQGRYRFNADGSLNLKWERECPHANTP